MFRPSHLAVGAVALMAAACSDSDNDVVHTLNSATIRLVNDTDTPLSLATGGPRDSLNARIAFGEASTCVFIDFSNVPALTVRNAVTGAFIPFTPVLSSGDNLTIVAFDGIVDTVQFAALRNRFVPIVNTAGLRFFNGVSSPGPLLMARSGAALTGFVGFGSASGFVSVPTDSARITFANSASVVLDAGLMAFPRGENSTVVLGPPAVGTQPIRFFTVQGC
jgi:hypothetical protein